MWARLAAAASIETMRILWVISSLGAGGAERVTASLTGELAKLGHEVHLATLSGAGQDAYVVSPEVRRTALELLAPSSGAFDVVQSTVARLRGLRRAMLAVRPDVIVSFVAETNVAAVVASRRLGVPVVVSERVHPGEPHLSPAWKFFRRVSYPAASLVVVPATDLAAAVEPLSGRRTVVIANPIARDFLRSDPDPEGLRGRTGVLAVGRLTPQKSYPVLLRAFASIAPSFPRSVLRIIGEGPERQRLGLLADQLGIAGNVRWLGQRRDMVAEYDRAGVFVLASRHEGFPNVLAEAMSRGLPVVSTDCPTGPADLIEDGVDGFLCPVGDSEAIAARLALLLASADERVRLGRAALGVRERLAPALIARQWEAQLLELAGARAARRGRRRQPIPVS